MFFLFSLGAEMIRAGSLPSHARAKRDKPQTSRGEGAWQAHGGGGTPGSLVPLLVRTQGPYRKEQSERPAWQAFPQSSWILPEPLPRPGLSADARCKSVAAQTPLPLSGNLPLSGKSAKEQKPVPKCIQPSTLIDKSLPRTIIQTLHPGKTSSHLGPR